MRTRQVLLLTLGCGVLSCTYPFGDVEIDGTGGNGAGASGGNGATSTGAGSSVGGNDKGGEGPGGEPASGGGGAGEQGGFGGLSAGGGGGASDGELCTNGIDDDDDAAVDCEDNDCIAFACGTPGGWSGPVYFALGTGPNSPPSCPTGVPLKSGWVSFGQGAATCTPCACSNFTTCQQASFATSDQCELSGDSLDANACEQVFITGGMAAANPQSGPASCNASGGIATLPSNGNAAALCELDCIAGSCLGATPLGLDGPCVFAPDSAAPCPAGYPVLRQIEELTSADTRGCASCGCGAPDNFSCEGFLRFYNNSSCAGLLAELETSTCVTTPLSATYVKYVPLDAMGSCMPNGGAPIGAAATARYDVCCAP